MNRLMLCTGACFLSIGLLIPAIPRYLTGPLGQGPGMIGGALAISSVCAVLARPLAGRLADRRGRGTAIRLGTLLLAAVSPAVLLADSLPLFLVCRAVAGAGEALTYVGLAAAASDRERPGTAINHFSVAVNAGLLVGPALAETVHSLAGFEAVWALSGAVAAVAFVVCPFIPGTSGGGSPDRAASSDGPAARRGPLLHRAGLRPGLAYWASVWGYTAFSAFLPLHVAALGGGGSGPHFLLYGGVLIAVRLCSQRLPAGIDPRRTATASLALTAVGLALLAAWPSPAGALCAVTVIGAGQALGLPTFLTMAVTGLPAGRRGSAVATTTAFFDVGFLTAALVLGAVAESAGVTYGFAVAAGVTALAPLMFLPRSRQDRDLAPRGDNHDHSRR